MKLVILQQLVKQNVFITTRFLLSFSIGLTLGFTNILLAVAQVEDKNPELVESLSSELQEAWQKKSEISGDTVQAPLAQKSASTLSSLEQDEKALLERLSEKVSAEETGLPTTQPAVAEIKLEAKPIIINEANNANAVVPLEENSKADARPVETPASKAEKETVVSTSAKAEEIKDSAKKIEKNAANTSKLNRRISDLESLLSAKNKELEDTRARLLMAETQVERLSTIIEKSSKQELARYLGNKELVEAPLAQPEVRAASNKGGSNLAKPALATDFQQDTLVGLVNVPKAHLRLGPSAKDSPIMTVSKGTRLVVETRHSDWYRVITPTGGRAWIQTQMLSFGPATTSGSSASNVKIAGYEKPKPN